MLHPKKIVIMRHPESEGNVLSCMGKMPEYDLGKGTHKFDLSPLGERQALAARAMVHKIYPEGFDVCFASQYLRAKKLHKIIFPKIKPIINEQLNEFDRGYWWLYSDEDIKNKFPEEYKINNLKGKEHHQHLGGESRKDLKLRIRNFLMWLSMYHSGESVFICGHGTWIKALLQIVEPDKYFKEIYNCELFEFVPNKKGNILKLSKNEKVNV